MRHFRVPIHPFAAGLGLLALVTLLAGCGSSVTAKATKTPTVTPLPSVTSTPQPVCTQLVAGATPYTSISGLSGMILPSGAYVSAATPTGGGQGQFAIATYTVCFQGGEGQIDGVGGVSNSTISQLHSMGWTINNLRTQWD